MAKRNLISRFVVCLLFIACPFTGTVAQQTVVRFAIVSDPHIAVPAPGFTLEDDPYIDSEPGRKLHRESVELLSAAIDMVNATPNLDFVLIPGDLTKDSERYNHEKLLGMLPGFTLPVYVVGGNHDVAHSEYGSVDPNAEIVDADELPILYADYWGPGGKPYYSVEPVPGVQLIALHSSRYQDHDGEIPEEQLAWLRSELEAARDGGKFIILMLHHSIGNHFLAFDEAHPLHSLFDSMVLENAEQMKSILKEFGVQLVVTGHMHVQDIVEEDGIYYIATGATVTYPHPIRILELDLNTQRLQVTTQTIQHIPSRPQLQTYSREALSAWYEAFVTWLYQTPAFGIPADVATLIGEEIRETWPMVCAGDESFQYTLADLIPEGTTGDPETDAQLQGVLDLMNGFSDRAPQDNNLTIHFEPVTAVEEIQTQVLPSGYALSQNFPNPFNPATTIRYSLPVQSQVRLDVYNMLGQQVALLHEGVQRAGNYRARFDGTGLGTGVYFCRLEAGSFSQTRKMLLVK